jgi:hypothetical protein
MSKQNRIHDRRSTEQRLNPVVAVRDVEDPYDGSRIAVLVSLRDDPLGLLYARHHIDTAQFNAGRHWQQLYEASQIGGVRGMDTTHEPVDSSTVLQDLLAERRRRAIAKLMRVSSALGRTGDALVRDILGRGMFVNEAATARGILTPRGIATLGSRFRECLEDLAKEFGYA